MTPMERPTVSRPPASGPQRTDATETGTAEATQGTLRIEHTKLPGLGSGPIFPINWLWKLFRRATLSR